MKCLVLAPTLRHLGRAHPTLTVNYQFRIGAYMRVDYVRAPSPSESISESNLHFDGIGFSIIIGIFPRENIELCHATSTRGSSREKEREERDIHPAFTDIALRHAREGSGHTSITTKVTQRPTWSNLWNGNGTEARTSMSEAWHGIDKTGSERGPCGWNMLSAFSRLMRINNTFSHLCNSTYRIAYL